MNESAPRSTYSIPDGPLEGDAVHAAVTAAIKADTRLARLLLVYIAAGVRDILTGGDPEAPFDASYVELRPASDGSLILTGRYWTAAGDTRTFDSTEGVEKSPWGAAYEMNEWVPYLDNGNDRVWRPLVITQELFGTVVGYRLDLVRAAAHPVD
ncbi:hypothetical protein [Streptomyces sp. NPDC091278]|uniref:hypothetical protein n=1 Tax=Streptomyces sp. NPDC091278 TaxID=3155301 RepID=UPI00344E0E0E